MTLSLSEENMKKLKKLLNNTLFSNIWMSINDIQYWKIINKNLDLIYSNHKDSLKSQYLLIEEGDE
jgi:hypothetical protein